MNMKGEVEIYQDVDKVKVYKDVDDFLGQIYRKKF